MKRFAFTLVTLLAAALSIGAQAAPRKRVAVLDFDYGTVHRSVNDIFGADVDIGKGIADMLIADLVRAGTYSVIERKQIDAVMREQNFQQSGRADPATAAQLAKILGVDAIIIGSITQFGRDDHSVGITGGGVSIGGIGIGGVGTKSSKATVTIDARIVSATTAEILGVATGHGESSRSGVSLAAGLGTSGGAGAGKFDMGSSNFASTIIGEATKAAVDNLTGDLDAAAARIPETKVEIRALVADVTGAELIINVGSESGVRVGAEYDVARPGREIKDPATGKVLRRTTTPVGKIRITQADEGSATGTLTGGPAKVGDCVGSCPANAGGGGGGNAPPSTEPFSHPTAAAVPAAAAHAPLPAKYGAPVAGPFTWAIYTLKGTERFTFAVHQSAKGSPAKNGSYAVDVHPAAGSARKLTISGVLDGERVTSSPTVTPNETLAMTQLSALGPLGATLFNPAWASLVGGHPWQVGASWQSAASGETTSFKVESTCQYAGVSGLKGVWRKQQTVLVEMCVSPLVGLPLSVSLREEDGSSTTSVELTDFAP